MIAQCPHCGEPAHVHFCLSAPMCRIPDCQCRIPSRRADWRVWDGKTGETKIHPQARELVRP